MVDCMWLAAHPGAEYPIAPERYGHRRDNYSNSFFPLHSNINGELFGSTKKFGYSCQLADIPKTAPNAVSLI